MPVRKFFEVQYFKGGPLDKRLAKKEYIMNAERHILVLGENVVDSGLGFTDFLFLRETYRHSHTHPKRSSGPRRTITSSCTDVLVSRATSARAYLGSWGCGRQSITWSMST